MRFNKGSASVNKFNPLPKIEEAAQLTEEKELDTISAPDPATDKEDKLKETEKIEDKEEKS